MDWALFDNCDFFGSPASERTQDSLNCKNLKIDRKSPMMAGKGNSHDKFLNRIWNLRQVIQPWLNFINASSSVTNKKSKPHCGIITGGSEISGKWYSHG